MSRSSASDGRRAAPVRKGRDFLLAVRDGEQIMQDELATIDTSPLDALMGIKSELETLESRLSAMEERKESVAAPVYLRVRNDYEARRKSLEADAAPLKSAARTEYARLATLLKRSEADHEAARLDREEIEFRHALGEFDKNEFKRRLADIDAQLSAKAQSREEALAMRQRFVAAFRSEEELESSLPPPPASPPAAAAVDNSDELPTRRLPTLDPDNLPPAVDPAATVVGRTLSVDDIPPPNAPPSTPASTQILRANKPGETLPPNAPTPTPAGRAPSKDAPTGPLRSARLVPQNPQAGKISHQVGVKPLVLGSGDDCDIRIAGAAGRHAEVRASMAGFTVIDLGHGVRVNGVGIDQHLLRHDDVLEIGPARFTFREA
jgi:hypothetical protein